MEQGSSEREPQGGNSSTQADFHWKHSDNSFAFNFLPEASSSLNHTAATPLETQAQPGQGKGSDTGSCFTFNFQIPAGSSETSAMQAGRNEIGITARELSEDSSRSKAKKKKKKKKGGGGEETGLQKNMNKIVEEAPKQERTELREHPVPSRRVIKHHSEEANVEKPSPEQQLSRELDWCIEQLELGLRTQKSSAKQREEASRALKTLRSSKAPVVKKRQVMRAVSGDYRRKMEEEKNKQFKLIQSAMASVRVSSVSEPSRKPVFHRCAETKRPGTDKPQDTRGLSHADEQISGDVGKFVFRPACEEFRFNFDL